MEQYNKKPEKSKIPKASAETKHSKLKTAPPVRQTLTSQKRILNANPLLKYEAGINIPQFQDKLKCKGISLNKGDIYGAEFKKPEVKLLPRTQSLKLPKSKNLDARVTSTSIISGNLPLTNNHFKKPTPCTSLSNKINENALESKSENTSKKNAFKLYSTLVPLKSKPKKTENIHPKHLQVKKQMLRRSLSADDIRKKNIRSNLTLTKPSNSQSVQNPKTYRTSENHLTGISPITTDANEKENFIFKSPSAYRRRSICGLTPHATKKKSFLETSTPAFIETHNLEKRLIKWLKARGKPSSSFINLRYFDKNNHIKKDPLSINTDEGNTANKKSENYENPEFVTTPTKAHAPSRDDIPEEELPKVVKKAMVELQELIQENYPRAQCLGWLHIIEEKYGEADKEPEYWECRATIEQCAGNVGNAVEFYKTAIIQGAEVSTVNQSLDQLWEKFSQLYISSTKFNQNKKDGNKERIARELKTAFKRSIIQCAVQKRALKK